MPTEAESSTVEKFSQQQAHIYKPVAIRYIYNTTSN